LSFGTHRWVDERTGTLDDAAVVRPEGATRSLVLTMDVITPIVDDPRSFGHIAAANALSDVWAMGGRPEVALAFAGCPTEVVGNEVLREMLAGVNDACRAASCAVVGGHTMKDSEPKCGLAVVGSVDPDRVWSQRGVLPGDVLLLSKAIGTGLAGQAIRNDSASPELMRRATAQMMALNDVACEVGLEHQARACTDVTGFGLLGHLRNVVEAAGVAIRLRAAAVPQLPGVRELAAAGCVPGGSRRNLSYAAHCTEFDASIDEATQLVLADAQTSGGLVLFLPAERADAALGVMRERGLSDAALIGEVAASDTPRIVVR
jgi:selenide,water dikinase